MPEDKDQKETKEIYNLTFSENFETLYAYAQKLTQDKDEAEELVYDVFVQYYSLMERRNNLPIQNEGAFLARLLKHKYLTNIRKKDREKIILSEFSKKYSSSPLELYFDLSHFTPNDVTEMLSILSDIYYDISGDKLIIKGITLLDPSCSPMPVEV